MSGLISCLMISIEIHSESLSSIIDLKSIGVPVFKLNQQLLLE
jgi:hypothetical protein